MQKRIDKATALVLGERSTRLPDSVLFERTARAKPIEANSRCYGLTNMVEQPRRASGPPAALKVINGQMDDTQRGIRELVNSVTEFGMFSWECEGPRYMQDTIRRYADMVNTPRVGSAANYMWQSCQLNLARPQYSEDKASLERQMGHFGGPHIDDRDSPMSMSCATSLSDLPNEPGWESGRLHLLGVGVYSPLERFTQLFFTGLLRHGGTSPIAPPNAVIPDWAYRTVHVAYPAGYFVSGEIKHAFAGMPNDSIGLHLTPEMTGGPVLQDNTSLLTNRSNSAMDGCAVMSDRASILFHARGLLQLAHWVMCQLSPDLAVHIDSASFLAAFSYADNGVMTGVGDWPQAPLADVQSPYGVHHRETQQAMLHRLYDCMTAGIPTVGVQNPFRDVDIRNVSPVVHKTMNPPPVEPKTRSKKRKRGSKEEVKSKKARRRRSKLIVEVLLPSKKIALGRRKTMLRNTSSRSSPQVAPPQPTTSRGHTGEYNRPDSNADERVGSPLPCPNSRSTLDRDEEMRDDFDECDDGSSSSNLDPPSGRTTILRSDSPSVIVGTSGSLDCACCYLLMRNIRLS
ncbi:hypothetical protein BDW22DRAFT_1433758 [Trametopsis cervina]|nr:hypothetical protein BDW22DRAFT_1433758 [Trametopsis cervina]